MKIIPTAIFICFLTCFFAQAQESAIIVLSIKGQIEYMKDQSSEMQRLLPGMKISPSGAIKLADASKVSLLHHGKYIQLDEAGAYDLNTLIKKNDKALSMNFAGRFWNFVSDGLSHSDDKEDLNEYNEKLLSVAGGVQGFALDEPALKTIMPAGGKIGTDIVTFNWKRSKNPSVFYHFKIQHVDDEALVFKAVLRDTSITLDFGQLVFHPEEMYEWWVEEEIVGQENEMKSSDLRLFEYNPNGNKIYSKEAAQINEYKKADDFDKKWMEAIVMEQEDFVYDAYDRYSNLLLQNPDNLLIKKLFAAFLTRQGLTQEGEKLLEK